MRDLLRDDRGVAIQVGASILLAIVVVAITAYQVQVVPVQNADVERSHSETLRERFQTIRGSVVDTANGRTGNSVTVPLGFRYPSRALFLNPAPPDGRLSTVGTRNRPVAVRIDNASATGEAGDVWNGTPRNFTTGSLVYRPDYEAYSGPQSVVYENTLVVERYENATIAVTDQTLVDGREISIPTLGGDLRRQGARTVAADIRAVSVSTRPLTVSNRSGPLTVTVPTQLPESTWTDALADEIDTTGDPTNDRYVRSIRYQAGEPYSSLTVVFEPNAAYALRLGRAGIGANASVPGNEGRRYVVGVPANRTDARVGSNATIEFEGRDAYDNPAADVTIDDGDVAAERVNYTLNVEYGMGAGDGGGVDWLDPSGQPGTTNTSCDARECVYDFTNDSTDNAFTLTGKVFPTASSVGLEYEVADTSVGELTRTSGETDTNGTNETAFTAKSEGETDVIVSRSGDTDRIAVVVTDGQGGPTTNMTLTWSLTDNTNPGEGTRYRVDYDVTDPDDEFGAIRVIFDNTDGFEYDGIEQDARESGTITYDSGTTDTTGDTYEIRLRVFNEDGVVVLSDSCTDVSDGTAAPGCSG
ncbi:hypothetical protein BRD17_04890 [Halobacteriales archaeon SW_7_68_16]|nr:MAG: hypothetical protein BRD17_04890 [Halobacteriales archaeon SW_7_68_16]